MRAVALLPLTLASAGCIRTPDASSAAVRLSHPLAAERLAAARELDRTPDPQALRPLLRVALADPDPRVRQEAALALEAAREDSVEGLAMKDLAGTRDIALAGWLLDSRLDAVRCGAIGVLRDLGTPSAWARLADRMDREDSSGVRVLCARALAQGLAQGAGPSQARLSESLRRGLGDREPAIRQACARALALEGESCAAGVLAASLAEATEAERPELLELLRVATGEDLGADPGPWMVRYGGNPGTRG